MCFVFVCCLLCVYVLCVLCMLCVMCYVQCSVMSRYHGRAGRHGLRTPRMHESKCSGHAMTMLPPPRPAPSTAQHQPPEIIHFPTLTTVSQSLESTLPHRHNSIASTIAASDNFDIDVHIFQWPILKIFADFADKCPNFMSNVS